MPQRSGRRTQRGFTLTELAIVLGIMSVILGAIWTAAAQVSANNKTQRAANQVLQIISNYRTLYAQHSIDVADGTDITCTGVNANFFPADIIAPGSACTASASGTNTYTGSALTNPWNGSVSVWASQSKQGIAVVYSGLTNTQCNNFADASASSQSPDLIWEQINATNQSVTSATPAWGPSAINGLCNAGDFVNSVQLMFNVR